MEEDRCQAGIYYKQARQGGQHRLSHEAQMLAALRHPGIVALAADPGPSPTVLALAEVAGGDISGRRFVPEETAGLGAAAATTLADIHDLGVVYGGCSAAHILLGTDGAPVLCSFGASRFATDTRQMGRGQRDDVAALIGVLEALCSGHDGRLQRSLHRAARRGHSARMLSRVLAGFDGARLPAPSRSAPSRPAPRDPPPSSMAIAAAGHAPGPAARSGASRAVAGGDQRRRAQPALFGWRRRTALAAVIVAATACATFVATEGEIGKGPRPPTGCPPSDEGCRPVNTAGGILTTAAGRWSLGVTRGVVVLGRWRCGPSALPAVLQLGSGQVWVFDHWASAGHGVAARQLGRVPGATSLAVIPGRGGCDRIEVLGPSSRRAVLDPS